MDIKLALRLRAVIFFNYLFPLIFFFTFATVLRRDSGAMTFVVTMSVTLGVLGSGFFGAGIRAIQERELGILRRYKVTPITPAPLLVGSMITGWAIFIPYIVLLLLMAHFIYAMPLPLHFFELLAFISLGLIAFRALGLVIASVANTMQEGTILVQLFYFPMLLLSGATFPAEKFPRVMQIIHNFIPATYLVQGMQNIMLKGQSLTMRENNLENDDVIGPAVGVARHRRAGTSPADAFLNLIARAIAREHLGRGAAAAGSPGAGKPLRRGKTSRKIQEKD